MSHYISGEHIKKLREKLNLTQNQLAEMLSVSNKTISKWETGRGLPDLTLIGPLSEEHCTGIATGMGYSVSGSRDEGTRAPRR